MEKGKRINTFTDLFAWQEAHKLVLIIYKVVEKFPDKEKFSLNSQICRASVSVSSNIAEGFGRASPKDKKQFYTMARGSITEVQNQLLVARDVGYINEMEFKKGAEQSVKAHKLTNGLIKAQRERAHSLS